MALVGWQVTHAPPLNMKESVACLFRRWRNERGSEGGKKEGEAGRWATCMCLEYLLPHSLPCSPLSVDAILMTLGRREKIQVCFSCQNKVGMCHLTSR